MGTRSLACAVHERSKRGAIRSAMETNGSSMVRDSKAEAQVVLRVVVAVRELRSYVIDLQQAYSKALGEEQIDAPACLQGKGIRRYVGRGTRGKGAAESVSGPKKPIAKDLQAWP